MWSRISLRTRLTIFTALIITAICVCLTFVSIFNAKNIFTSSHQKQPSASAPEIIEDMEDMGNITGSSLAVNAQFNQISIIYMLIFIALGTGLTYFISGRALKPVTDLSHAIDEMDENKLNTQINIKNGGVEIEKLTGSFNQMLLKLESAFEGQKRFAHHAAHELKTPLSAIMTNIEVLELEENPSIEEYKEIVDITKESTERLIQLVSELLNLNVNLSEDRIKQIDVHKMFDQIIRGLNTSIKEKNISISNKCDHTISGDPELLYHAFFNLIHNAVKYNKNGGEIEIYSKSNKLIIKDTGIGIPPSDLTNIFEPFYCVDPSRSRKLGGSGLGLSVVKAIIDKHNGKIWVESDVGVGTQTIVEI